MSGQIKCNTCSKKMLSTGQGRGTCPKCGSPYCHITVYWQGEYHPYYRDKDNNVFTYTIALRQLVIMNAQMEAGEFQPEEWETGFLQERRMDHAINQWLTEIKMLVALKKKKPSTYTTYRTHVTRNILNEKYGLGKYDVREITIKHLQLFMKNLLHLSSLYQRTTRGVLHIFFQWAAEQMMIENIPVFPKSITKAEPERERVALLHEIQTEAIQKIPEKHRDIFLCETETGMRPGEACALKIKDFNEAKKQITIRRNFSMGVLVEDEYKPTDKEGHGATLPLSECAFEIIKKHAANRFPDDFIFINPNINSHYTVNYLNSLGRKYSGLSITHYEATRHSFITQSIKVNSLKETQELARHKVVASTMKYIHLEPEDLRAAMDRRADKVASIDQKRKKHQGRN